MTETTTVREQLATSFDKSAAAVRAYADQFEKDYGRPALQTSTTYFEQYPITTTFVAVFGVLSFVPVASFLSLSVFAIVSISFLALSCALISSAAVILFFLSILVFCLFTALFFAGCITITLFTSYVGYRLVILIRSGGREGVSTWAVETKGRFTYPKHKREESGESAVVVDAKPPTPEVDSDQTVKQEGSDRIVCGNGMDGPDVVSLRMDLHVQQPVLLAVSPGRRNNYDHNRCARRLEHHRVLHQHPSGGSPTLVPGWAFVRAVEDPNFHKYLMSQTPNTATPAILGDFTRAAQFQIVNGQLMQNGANGVQLFAVVAPPADATVKMLAVSWATKPDTLGTFFWSGDSLEWKSPTVARQQTNAWLVCPSNGVLFLYINLGPYAFMTPAGCNKNYLPGQPVVPPGGQFQYEPGVGTHPLLVLRCAPIMIPYIEGEDHEAGVLVEAFVTHALRYPDAQRMNGETIVLEVSISSNGDVLSTSILPLNSTRELYFPLANLSNAARKQPFQLDCIASTSVDFEMSSQTFNATTELAYLPPPIRGSVTKRDGRTGALLVRKYTDYEPIFPFGFYTSFDGYLDADLGILDKLKAAGHVLVPTFGDLDALERVLDRMEELGLYLVYDMRHTYRNPAAEVNLIKHRPNLLLWYTADEPDGTSEPLDATVRAYDTIHALDGYHPVSIALNCADYEFAAYVAGADVIMPDTYTVANDPEWSLKYNTSCTPEFGCCGCDNCSGRLKDVSRRLDDFAFRLDVRGWTRHKAVWSVPQAFGGEEFWTRVPTAREFVAQVILSVNHGARGIMPWIDPTSEDIKTAASSLSTMLNSPNVKRVIFNPKVSFTRVVSSRIDVGIWAIGGTRFLMATNLNDEPGTIAVPWLRGEGLKELLDYGARVRNVKSGMELQLEGLGSGVFIQRPGLMFQDTQLQV
ncbi:hypothetical protein MKEN_00235700 [Mycena kentingensis (nom. inval.)]|nr:hypothetical protein MKEN_00235700 [Mycena kentingensis (nom. inval.)]